MNAVESDAADRRFQAFNADVQGYVVSMGGHVVDGQVMDTAAIETKAGLLYVGGMGTWVYCRFDDVPRANAAFGNTEGRWATGGPNPHTGKYNFHGIDAFESFKRALAALLPTPVEPPKVYCPECCREVLPEDVDKLACPGCGIS